MLWLPVALAVTALAPFLYAVPQQVLRSSANDPQTAPATDAVSALDAGRDPRSVVGSDRVDLTRSLSPWVAVFDSSRHLVATSGEGVDAYATSVFDSVAPGERHEVTWQPSANVRQATVVMRWNQGWIVSGRSLALVEERENQVLLLATVAWLAALAASLLGAVVVSAIANASDNHALRQH